MVIMVSQLLLPQGSSWLFNYFILIMHQSATSSPELSWLVSYFFPKSIMVS